MKNKYPLSRKEEIVVRELKDETLVYDLREKKAFCLNQTSSLIWKMCDGTKSLSELSRELSQTLKQPANEGLIWLALEQLKKENLIENEYSVPSEYEGMTRRETVRKIGLATMIAIPVIMSLQAPMAVSAASTCSAPDTTCHCEDPSCPGDSDTVVPANQASCPGARLPNEAARDNGFIPARPIVACNSGCQCIGPFTCVRSTVTKHKRGFCAS